jgi:exo-beta-1,3-glucanase (GH17 family)
LLSQLTTVFLYISVPSHIHSRRIFQRIRLYGADCNQSALVLDAIQQTKVNMTVYLGNYAVPTDNNTAYDRQRDVIKDVLQTFGTNNIGGLTVGNEFMLNYLTANGANDPNSAVGDQGAALLKADIDDTRSMVSAMNLPTHVPIGTADAGAYFNTLVLEDIEYGVCFVCLIQLLAHVCIVSRCPTSILGSLTYR